MVIHDTECPYWDQVSLNNTNPLILMKEEHPYETVLWMNADKYCINTRNCLSTLQIVWFPQLFLSTHNSSLKLHKF